MIPTFQTFPCFTFSDRNKTINWLVGLFNLLFAILVFFHSFFSLEIAHKVFKTAVPTACAVYHNETRELHSFWAAAPTGDKVL